MEFGVYCLKVRESVWITTLLLQRQNSMSQAIDSDHLAQWRKRLAQFRISQLSATEFCRRESISEGKFYYWSRRLKKLDAASALKPLIAIENAIPVPAAVNDTIHDSSSTRVDIWISDSLRVSLPATCEALIGYLLDRLRETPNAVGQSSFQRIDLHAR